MNQWGYIDPVGRVHEHQAPRAMGHQPQPMPVQAPQPVVSPLAGLNQAVPEITYAAGYPRYENTAERMLVGAVLGGLLGWMFVRRREARKQRKAAQLQALKASLGIEEDE